MSTLPMEFLGIVVFKKHAEAAVTNLLRLGIFHPVDIRDIETELKDLSPLDIEKEYAEWESLEVNLNDILRKLGPVSFAPKQNETDVFSYDKIKETLANIEDKLNPLINQREALGEELKTQESIFNQIKEYFPLSIKGSSYHTLLEVRLGKIEEKNIPALERSLSDIPHLTYPFNRQGQAGVITLVIGLRRDRAVLDKVLKDFSWEKVVYPEAAEDLSPEVENKLKSQIEEYKKKILAVEEEIKGLRDSSSLLLQQIRLFIKQKKSLLEAKKYSCATEKTVLISGWVPREEKERVKAEIKKIDPCFYIEEREPEEMGMPKEEVPVRLRHNPVLKPFELLIDSYGVPRYGSIDPTIFTAISFLLMFGAMFGDIGHGLVLALAGIFLRKSKKEGTIQAGTLVLYCGISSILFGFLYGSIFGFEFPSVWIKPMHNILELFRLSVFFGIGMISLGILINVINALRDKDYIKAIFDKAGLIAGVIYWLAIGVVSKFMASKTAVSTLYIKLIIFGFMLLFLRPAIEFIFLKEKKKENLFMSLMESMVELLEIFIGYLSNTVSFMRIAAYAITHFCLFMAIFELSRVMKGAGFIILILGNIVIILLEGLVSSIQAIRLNYYEFFSKFFIAGKEVYRPITIAGR